MKKNFTIEEVQNFARVINCMDYDRFSKMYKEIGLIGESYIVEKFEKKNTNFLNWFCELSDDYIEKMIEFINNK